MKTNQSKTLVRRPRPSKELRAAHANCLHNFDQLPDSAEVPVQVVAALKSVTPVTIWRWSKAGKLPKPIRRGGTSRWNVGQLRRVAASE